MIETDHQNFFAIGVSWLVPDLFSKITKNGTGTESVSRATKILKQLFTEFHSLFVCKVSVGSDWQIWRYRRLRIQ